MCVVNQVRNDGTTDGEFSRHTEQNLESHYASHHFSQESNTARRTLAGARKALFCTALYVSLRALVHGGIAIMGSGERGGKGCDWSPDVDLLVPPRNIDENP